METPPKMPMLYFESKSATSLQPDFSTCISNFIECKYQENPNSYLNEVNELSKLRNSALRQLRDIAGCNVLKRYYAQLSSLNNRFKMANEKFSAKFVWVDIFSERHVSGDINYEMAAIMFNIGALHAELGALDPRKDDSGMKMACTHFQCAAWAFEQIKNNPIELESKDMSHDLLSFMYQVTIAQAQECILDKSISDKRKPSIIAKVAAQVVEYYNTALLGLLTGQLTESATSVVEIVGSKLFKDWKRFVEIKISYYSAVTNLYMGISCEDSNDPLFLESKGGERVAWTLSALDRIKEAEKEVEKMERIDMMMKDSVVFMKLTIDKKLKSAKNDNDHIYHKPVPSSDKLTAVKGASLVKPIPFSVTDPEIFVQDIFSRLIPMEVHEMASVYTDKKDHLIRTMKSKIDSKNEELITFMSSLNLDMDAISVKSVNVIPDELIEICAAMSIKKDNVDVIDSEMKQLEESSAECGQLINEIKMMLMKESTSQAKFLLTSGIKGASTSNSHSKMMETFEKELEKLDERFQKSVESDVALKKSYEAIIPDIELLRKSSDGASLSSILPSSEVPVSEGNIDRLKLLLSKVDEMKTQRVMLEEKLRSSLQSDDISSKVISQPDESKLDELYEQEIKKFDKQVDLLNQNLSAQENIMAALTTANAEFVPTRKAKAEMERKRIERIKQLTDSYKKYQDVLSHIEKGIYFYKRLLESVRGIKTRINSFIASQEQHRNKPPPQSFHPVPAMNNRNPLPSRSRLNPVPNVTPSMPASTYQPSPYLPPPVNYSPVPNMNQSYSQVPSSIVSSPYNNPVLQSNTSPYNTLPNNVVPNHGGLHVPGSHNIPGPHNQTIYNPTSQYTSPVYQYNNQHQQYNNHQPPMNQANYNNGVNSYYGHPPLPVPATTHAAINLMDEPIPSIEDKNVLQPMNPGNSQSSSETQMP